MASSKEGERKRREPSIGTMERLDEDRLRLKTFWSPFPSWILGTGIGVAIAALVSLVALAGGRESSELTSIASIAFIVGYFVGAIVWAVLGAMGGDLLEVTFDLEEDEGYVHQSLVWTWQRDWSFDLDAIERVHVWDQRGRFLLKLNVVYWMAVTLEDDKPLRLGKYPSEGEVMKLAKQLAAFIDVPIRRSEPGKDA